VDHKDERPTWPWQHDPELRRLAEEYVKQRPEMDREFDRRQREIRRMLRMPEPEGSEAG
jgi:hypothetical protein